MFDKNKIYVFSKGKLTKLFPSAKNDEWVELCKGKVVNVTGKFTGNIETCLRAVCAVSSDWCTEVKQNYKYNG